MAILTASLLEWFSRTARDLPWRHDRTPYRVWLAEIMLQQTQVATAIPYYKRFLDLWPDFHALAKADEQQVLKAWEGLGYYSRARNLRRTAILVVDTFSGNLPADEQLIRSLPGIGEYTAGAVGSIAFNLPIAAVDGNVVRVFSRLNAVPWNATDPADRRKVREQVEAMLPPDRPGDFNEALMDLGATVCLPRNPDCQACPLSQLCQARILDRVGDFPTRKQARVVLMDDKIVLVHQLDGLYHVNRRPAKGLLAGLFEFDWLDAQHQTVEQSVAQMVAQGARVKPLPAYTHRFTHRIWSLTGFLIDQDGMTAHLPETSTGNGRWVNAAELSALPFPTALEPYRQAVLTLG